MTVKREQDFGTPRGSGEPVSIVVDGHEVTVLEAADTIGGGTRSSEMIVPGLLHDHCSAFHPIAAASSFLRELDLEGLRIDHEEGDIVQAGNTVVEPLQADLEGQSLVDRDRDRVDHVGIVVGGVAEAVGEVPGVAVGRDLAPLVQILPTEAKTSETLVFRGRNLNE